MASTRSRASEPASPTTKTTRRRATASAPKRARKASPPAAAGHDDIARRAFAIFESEGGGDHLEHWLRAERELAAA